MAKDRGRESIDELLALAHDVCLAVGAFAVAGGGAVHAVVSDAMPPVNGLRRIEGLARSCLTHPGAAGRDLFWSAEVTTGPASGNRSLACVVAPVWDDDDTQVGLLGVVDTWLPEPDDVQRGALVALARRLAPVFAHEQRSSTSVAPAPAGPVPAVLGAVPAGPGAVPAGPGPVASAHSTVPHEAAEVRAGDVPSEPAVTIPGPGVSAGDLAGAFDEGIVCVDQAGIVVLANTSADELHGLVPPASMVGSRLPDTSPLRSEDGHLLGSREHPGHVVLRTGAEHVATLLVGENGDDQRRVTATARPFVVAGHLGALVVMRDTTAAWKEQQRLTHFALHDPLTGLANRYLLVEELRRMLQGLARRGGSVALVFLDLDDFKRINDEHGHDVGDEVLAAVAGRLQGAVRGDDVVARLGGDEFVIAHASSERLSDGDMVVSRIRKVLSAPFRVRGTAFDVGTSVGWVSTETDGVSPDALLATADRAMYRHKRDRAEIRRGAA